MEEAANLASDDETTMDAFVELADALNDPSHPQHVTTVGNARDTIGTSEEDAATKLVVCMTKHRNKKNNKDD